MDSDDDVDIGDIGESTILALASLCGISATEPRKDRYGWDVLLEFKNPSANVFLDQHESCYSVFVQVKAFDGTYDEYKGRNIKLSNIQNMITSTSPQFFAFVSAINKTVYLVHLDKEIIEQGLKRIREEQSKDPCVKLNKKYIKINPHNYNSIIIKERELKEKLISIIGSSQVEYVKNKRILTQNIGYGSSRQTINGKINPKDLLDVELGLKNSAKFELLNMQDVRFGIPLDYKNKPISVEFLSHEYAGHIRGGDPKITGKVGSPITLTFTEIDGGIPIEIPSSIRASILSDKFNKYVIENDYLKIIFDGDTVNFNLSLNTIWNRPERINKIIQILNVAIIISSDAGFIFEISSSDNQVEIVNKLDTSSFNGYDLKKQLSLAKLMSYVFDELRIDKKVLFNQYLDNIDYYMVNLGYIKGIQNGTEVARLTEFGDYQFKSKNIRVVLPHSITLEGENYVVIHSILGEISDLNSEYCKFLVSKKEIIYKTKVRGRKTFNEIESRLNNIHETKSINTELLIIESAYRKDIFDQINT